MHKVVWKMPVPATAILQGPFFNVLPKKECEILFSIESDGSEEQEQEQEYEKEVSLVFRDVEGFKCTYLSSTGIFEQSLLAASYGKLLVLENTPWLEQMTKSHRDYSLNARLMPKNLQHLMIYFDGGPCYEIICTGFTVT